MARTAGARLGTALVASVLGAVLLGLVTLAGPAGAQPYPPTEPDVCTTVTVVTPGSTVVICGRNWMSGTTVTITREVGGPVLGSARVAPDGSWRVEVPVADDAAGDVVFHAAGTAPDGVEREASLTLAVQNAALSDAADAGGPPMWLVLAGVTLGVAAVGALGWTRRRDHVEVG